MTLATTVSEPGTAYLERGLWRCLFKLEHASEGEATVLPSRYLIAAVLLFDHVAVPSTLCDISRKFSSGEIERVHAINRVPYEIPAKKALAFCPLEIGKFTAVVEQLQSLKLLEEYQEGNAYNPGASFGGGPPMVVTSDGSLAKKTYIWDGLSVDYGQVLALYKKQQKNDPDFVDNFIDATASGADEEIGKRLNFLDACIAAAQRDRCVPIVGSSSVLLPLLQECFPQQQQINAIDLVRLLVAELPGIRLTPEQLAVMRQEPRVKAIRASLHSRDEGLIDVDTEQLVDQIVNVLGGYRDSTTQSAVNVNVAGTWPTSSVVQLPNAQDLVNEEDLGSRYILYLWSTQRHQRVCIGYTRSFFDPY
jgi:hypothetical protein